MKFKYVFKVKKTKSNEIQRKSRLVAQGFTQVAGVNYHLDQTISRDKETRRSTSGMIVMMNGGPISWSSRLH
jgi:hypothetical protein